TFIQAKTTIGRGSSVAGTPRAHGLGIDASELTRLANEYSSDRGIDLWNDFADVNARPTAMPAWPVPDLSDVTMTDDIGTEISTRELSGKFVERMLSAGANLIGGSADLGSSTNVKTHAVREISPGEFIGNYINYGVREHAMGAIMNGLAAAGMRPFGGTFLAFSDYMRPSIRLAALSGLPVVYVFTHDSVAVGEDGPTHQPVEQLPALRLIPNMNVFRPCNGVEVAAAWTFALSDTSRPSCIVLSRQPVRPGATPVDADLSRGAYIIHRATARRVNVTILTTGSEVPLSIDVAEKLGPDVQVVSVLDVATFRDAPDEYRREMLRGYVVAIEAAATSPWFEFADAVVGIDEFGASGDGASVYRRCGFDADTIADQIRRGMKR
ncbi:transketolase, partial [bacterium]|nr:transketolase [bacterium]